MASRGSSWDGAPTSPLPAGPYLGETGQAPRGQAGWAPGTGAASRGRPRRRHRWLARIAVVVLGLILLGALVLGGLLLVTPSVGDAQAAPGRWTGSMAPSIPGPLSPPGSRRRWCPPRITGSTPSRASTCSPSDG